MNQNNMINYQQLIEDNLSKYMPKFTMAMNESEEYVSEAPKVNGYFKFISIRYMKRVKDIKNMCVEYINTYIDGALNLAKNMDDVKLVAAQESLSKDNDNNLAASLDFKKSGVSTDGEAKSANTKEGVLFLTGDKALKDKLEAILQKIQVRSKKSESLTEWANLMILQSKVIANNLIFEKVNEYFKKEDVKEQQIKKLEEEKKKTADKLKEVETEHKKYQKELETLTSNYGEPMQWFGKEDIKLSELTKFVKDISKKDFEENPVIKSKNENGNESTELNVESKIGELRNSFYNNYNMSVDTVASTLKSIEDGYDAKLQNYIMSYGVVGQSSVDAKFMASPIDICLFIRNNETAYKMFSDLKYKPIDGINLDEYDLELTSEDIQKANDYVKNKIQKIKDSEKTIVTKAVYYFTRLFTKEKGKLNESLSTNIILKPGQFITEEMIYNTLSLDEASDFMIDILSDCEDGCLYIGNFQGIEEADYAMLYNRDKWGFFIEQGDLEMALENGKPIHPKLVKFNDAETLDMLNIIFDTLGKDMMPY